MDAHKRMVVSDILAKENWQYIVPIYQRAYKWTNEEVTRLVKDIVKCGKGTKEHFVGSIVYQLDKNTQSVDLFPVQKGIFLIPLCSKHQSSQDLLIMLQIHLLPY